MLPKKDLSFARKMALLCHPYVHTLHVGYNHWVTFVGSVKKAYQECDLYMISRHLEKTIPCDVAGLFNRAHSRVAPIQKAISDFRSN